MLLFWGAEPCVFHVKGLVRPCENEGNGCPCSCVQNGCNGCPRAHLQNECKGCRRAELGVSLYAE
eukprot:1162062-Pelagomonas_calceolata.AAC.31